MFKHFSIFCAVLAGLAVLAGASNIVAQTVPDTEKASVVWQYFNTKQYDGDKRAYTEEDLYPPYALKGQASDSVVSQYLRLLRNEIFARHGKAFKDSVLFGFFVAQHWYQPSNIVTALNEYEKQNIKNIVNIEEKGKKNIIAEPEKSSSLKNGVKSVVIEAEWGDEPNKIGINYNCTPGPAGPTDFYITNDGYIYILDNASINIKIIKYNSQGLFVKVFNVRTIKNINTNIDIPQNIVVDEQENIYLISGGSLTKYNSNLEKIGSVEFPYLIGECVFRLENNKIYAEDNTNQWLVWDNNLSDIAIKQSHFKKADGILPSLLIGHDKNNNAYTLSFIDTETGTLKAYIYRYNNNGILLNEININKGDGYIGYPDYLARSDNDGNVYFMETFKSGLKIVKYIF